jgi:predicted amidophosphoribosyltransferase
MLLSELQYGALLSYASHGYTDQIKYSRDIMLKLKQDGFVQSSSSNILISKWIAQTIQRNRTSPAFSSLASLFQPDAVLVPTPKSSLMDEGTLWVPYRLAMALVNCGLGKEVAQILKRIKPVPKAALSTPENRPLPQDHYDSMQVQKPLSEPSDILLIDDVITRGATLLGAASRLADAFPNAHIRAFAAMRTITNESEFERLYYPTVGEITLRPSGDTLRRP